MRYPALLKLFIGLVAGGACAFIYWIHTPTYAIVELGRSLRDKDLATFYSRIDLDRIYDSSIDAMTAHELASKGAPSAFETMQANVSGGVTKLIKSQVINQLKRDIELKFITGKIELPAAPEPTSLIKEFFLELKSVTFGSVVRSDDGAFVNVDLELGKINGHYPLTLKMANENQWRISGFEGLATTLSRYSADRMAKVLEHNREAQRHCSELAPFFGQVRIEDINFALQKQIHLEFLFHNKHTSALKQLAGTLSVTDSKGGVITEPFQKDELQIKPGEKKVFLIPKELGLFGTLSEDRKFVLNFQCEAIHFMDGTSQLVVKRYEDL